MSDLSPPRATVGVKVAPGIIGNKPVVIVEIGSSTYQFDAGLAASLGNSILTCASVAAMQTALRSYLRDRDILSSQQCDELIATFNKQVFKDARDSEDSLSPEHSTEEDS